MDSSKKSLYFLIAVGVIAFFGFKILPRIVGFLFNGFFSTAIFLGLCLSAVGVLVMSLRWLLRRG